MLLFLFRHATMRCFTIPVESGCSKWFLSDISSFRRIVMVSWNCYDKIYQNEEKRSMNLGLYGLGCLLTTAFFIKCNILYGGLFSGHINGGCHFKHYPSCYFLEIAADDGMRYFPDSGIRSSIIAFRYL